MKSSASEQHATMRRGKDAEGRVARSAVVEGDSDVPLKRPLLIDAEYVLIEQRFKQKLVDDPDVLYRWSIRLLQAEHLDGGSDQKRAALHRHLQRMLRLEEWVLQRNSAWHVAAKFYVAEAEMMAVDGELRGIDQW